MSNMKFNATRFKSLIQQKLQQRNLSSRAFVGNNKFARSPFTKALSGVSRPSVDSLNNWCRALGCTPEERAEIIGSVYIDDEPSQQTSVAA